MAITKQRSSSQIYIDDNLDANSKKIINLSPATLATDAVNKDQMDVAIGNAVSGVGNSIHVPVADLATAKAVLVAGRADKMLMHIETLGLYRFDAESVVVSNDGTIIRPTDVATDAAPGRWLQLTSIMSSHELLSGLLGGALNDHQHLTTAELTKLTGIEALADVTDAQNVGAVLNAATAKAVPVDADTLPISDSAASGGLKKITWAVLKSQLMLAFNATYNWATYTHAATVKATPVDADELSLVDSAGAWSIKKFTFTNLKAFLKTYFDTLYVQPNATGDVTIVLNGAANIGTSKVVTDKIANLNVTGAKVADSTLANVKLSNVANNTIKGRITAGTGVVEDLTSAQIRTILGLTTENTSTRFFRATPGGLVNGSNTVFTISPAANAHIITGSEEVYKNGILMNAGVGNDYTIAYNVGSGPYVTTITFASAPSAASAYTDVILVNYSV